MFDKTLTTSTYIQGLHAEARALKHLESLGMICLLMKDGETIVAAEVKYRKILENAAYSIRPPQQKRIQHALEWWISNHRDYIHRPPFQRFDVVLVCPGHDIKYYKNAWISEVPN
jgi:Holliday junction resolvase-like predicted endonuclease